MGELELFNLLSYMQIHVYMYMYTDNLHVFLKEFSSYYMAMNHFKTFEKHVK